MIPGTAEALLAVVRTTHAELHRGATPAGIGLDSRLEQDLGFDSLARVELLQRVERTFGVALPEATLQTALTPRDLLAAIAVAPTHAAAPAFARASTGPPPATGGPAPEPAAAATLVEVLDWHVEAHPGRTQIILLTEGDAEERVDYRHLREVAGAVAAGLQGLGLQPRQTVAIMLPTSREYFFAYFGVLLAGGIPVPIYPPARPAQIEEHVRRHIGILANAGAGILVTVPEAMPVARLLEAGVPGLRRVVTVAGLTADSPPTPVALRADDIAFIQYTSGSTGNPKGVVLTHANLLANIRAIGQAIGVTPVDVFVSWLPLYHDMGLISAWLVSLYFGNPLVVMSPLAFLARPERWLWAIHRHRGTLSAAPNFAFELCLRRLADAPPAGLDLSSLRLLACGAEPVNPDTLRRFAERFAGSGLRPGALTPVYGLAEATVGLLVPPLGRGPWVERIDRDAFTRMGEARPAAPGHAHALAFVSCGRPLPGHQVRVVDGAGQELGERVEGRLEFKGPSAAGGYYRNPEQTRRLFHGGWLDSGDRAYAAAGEFFITGRVKDIIIRGGRNIYPHELELAVGELPGVRKGCVAVFGGPDPAAGTERLVVLAETHAVGPAGRAALQAAIARRVLEVLGEPADEVVLAPPGTVLKTSSGKVRRSACRELYEAGRIGARRRAVGWQVARLVLAAAGLRVRRGLALAGGWGYALRVGLLFAFVAPLTWLVTALLPRPEWAWAAGRAAARGFLRLCGTPVQVQGLEHLPPPGQAHVLVANHASYLDGIVLAAALPRHVGFVAKRELLGQFVPRIYLRRLGVEFVERFDARQGAEDAARLAAAVAGGRSLAFFPEGTFTPTPGLRPFHLGAFAAAAHARVPVVPVAIRGSRAWLPADQWRPRRSPLAVVICPPVLPIDGAEGFGEAVRLRDAARAEILRHCGEPEAGATSP